jgi:MFS family permease
VASIPGVVLSIVGGTVSDTAKKNNILIFMTSIQGILILFMAFLTITGKTTFILLCVFLFLLESCSRFYSPAFTALNVSIVDKKRYSNAQSFITTTNSLAQMIGSSVCTSLIVLFGYALPFFINSAFYFLSGLIIGITKFPSEKDNPVKNKNATKFLAEMKNGFIYFHGKILLLKLIIVLVIINLCLALFDVGLPFLLSDILLLPPEYLGYMKSVSTFAFIVAGIITSKLTIKKPLYIISICIFIMGVNVLGICISKQFIISCIFWGLAAFFRTIISVLLISNIATLPSEIYVGRVMGVASTLSSIGLFLSRGVSGIIVDNIGANSIFLISGIIFIFLAFFFWINIINSTFETEAPIELPLT